MNWLSCVVIENSKDFYNKSIEAGYAEVGLFFCDLVIGDQFTAEEKRFKVFTNETSVSFMVDKEDFQAFLEELRFVIASTHNSRVQLKLL